MEITFQSIGLVHSPFNDIKGMPIQPTGAQGIQGTIKIYDEFVQGLLDLEGFSHIILLYHLHKVQSSALVVTPFLDTKEHGIFATRAPKRPNPIGLSIVKLNEVQGNTLQIENVDILNSTPLIDIKPYLPEFDQHPADRLGWYEALQGKVKTHRSDNRFR
ncbi:MAG: tRNA (N6-threonylcarbamoyladenosine(37)-N6)-methyltransferase TrmO [Deltaproteobacteria bacterium]|jgi:tRNA (adenine37-N6)-methyltransferase|nr:tRNA (N6-threonylcarbamoyladenosine(37)-N6)-methyltransferase TrmO [Deltaproteobacteria bacterium]MBT4268219.1 tRNA (N6-threonylcarbamoyladenosine(37)-N6)-methyltransferase TrmO [Deltaproteobacteria bacterium]MBT4640151.1 tRNA (N6-threonylcarbamoyladenosine(37)-N6)-methyltransferase TrmO [Deltaproteobacteria bacterium]MBT6500686.1 tRNA (N6-threonylcarbamoyladenosine(37)-N6)-methyltransferase TrmO [Deltaproteobacteria bacterium]MBT6614229.1 tRNA (N6-threonylcarbamoyladenosine(37)-N6)-methyltr